MAELLARNYALSIDVIDALKREDPIERLAAMVLHLTSRDPGATPVVSVSQSDLGALARLSRSSVNAAISELQRRGWVRRAYASLEVIDKPGLSSFVRGS
jgi:CRP-like cAMP-binding protein